MKPMRLTVSFVAQQRTERYSMQDDVVVCFRPATRTLYCITHVEESPVVDCVRASDSSRALMNLTQQMFSQNMPHSVSYSTVTGLSQNAHLTIKNLSELII